MELRTNKQDLLSALESARKIAAADTGALLTATPDGLTITATNLALFVRAQVQADVREEGQAAVSATFLHSIVKALPGERVRLKLTGDAVLTIATQRDSYELGCLSAEFPAGPNEEGAVWATAPAAMLAGLLSRALPFASKDTDRYHLCSVLLTWAAGSARAVATDGHRLAVVTSTDPEAWQGAVSEEHAPLVPRDGVVEIQRFLKGAKEPVEVTTANGWLLVRRGAVLLAVRLVDAEFPPWQQLVRDSERTCIVERRAFVDAIKRALVMALRDSGYQVKLTFTDGALVVEAGMVDVGFASITLDADYQGEDFTIGMNGRYLLDGLAPLGDLVWIGMGGPLDPLSLRPCMGSGKPSDDFACLVMPHRLGDEDPEVQKQQKEAARDSRGPLFGDEPPVAKRPAAIETITICAPGKEPVVMTGEAFERMAEGKAPKKPRKRAPKAK